MGVGGTFYAMERLAANIIGTGMENPSDLFAALRDGKINRDNPFIKFMLSKTSPLTGTLVNVIENKNYVGEPFETPADWAKYVGSRILPISVSSTLFEKGNQDARVFAGNIMGLRTFPKSAWELREEVRNRLSQSQYGKNYDSLPELDKRRIDDNEEIQSLSQEADRSTELRGGLSYKFLQRQQEHDAARKIYVDTLNKAQYAFDSGAITGSQFRETMRQAGYALGKSYEQIDSQPEYKEVMEKLNKGTAAPVEVKDQAYNELVSASYDDRFVDSQTGVFDFQAYRDYRKSIRSKYGEEVWNYIEQREAEARKDLPVLAQEYYKARDILEPYWAVQDEVEKLFGKNYAESSRGQSFISKQRKNMRLSNPEVAKYYEIFYKT
jgi:hypothetical protein